MNNSIYALLHNESVLYILNNIQNIPSGQTNVKNVLKTLNQQFCTEYGIVFEDYQLPIYPQNPNEIDLRQWIIESPQSNELKNYLNLIIDIIEQELPQNQYYIQLDSLLDTANNVLNITDRIKFQDHILVAKRSYVVWFSEINGQREWLTEVRNINIPNPEDVVAQVNWWKVLGVDCIGGAMGGPAGYLGASGIAVIMQM